MKSLGLRFVPSPAPALTAYVDASWADDPDTRRSRFGFMIFFGGAPVSWRSKLHPSVSMSTAEGEYVTACECSKQVLWLRNLLTFLHRPPTAATVLYEDNDACIRMVANRVVSARNKHVELRAHFIRQLYNDGSIVLKYIPTAHQIADALTKSLPRPAFERFRTSLLNGPPAVPDNPSPVARGPSTLFAFARNFGSTPASALAASC